MEVQNYERRDCRDSGYSAVIFFFPRRHVDFFFIFLSLRATTAPFFLLRSLTEGPAAASDSFLYKRCGDNAALALAWRPT